ncbi:MAG: rhodanese-related sulfurtransferase [Verrucomicrobia bacterium]|nr:rhodanese-related sulfurtransferase [Verrucomicrobiota bacterium]
MSKEKKYFVIAFYLFTPIADPHAEVAKHQEFFKERDIKSRIYISHDGINAQMSALEDHAIEYMEWMKLDDRFKDIDFKIHLHHEQVFPRATVKFRKQLVALDHNANPHKGGEHIAPSKWKEMLEKEENILLLDVRNDYEWKIGRFAGAVKPKLDMFRKFPEYARKLKEEYDLKNTKVMMYCTGGIRCELYSALMKDEGFENVYQLNGGVIRYGLEQGEDLWEGKLFVFDDRLAVPLKEDSKAQPISECHFCKTPSDTYYNCASMDCNNLFISCPECAKNMKGCCCTACQSGSRMRVFNENADPKPFKRKHLCEIVRAG